MGVSDSALHRWNLDEPILSVSVAGWDNEADARVGVKVCYAEVSATAGGCGTTNYGLTPNVYQYYLTPAVDVLTTRPMDYAYLSVDLPGKPGSGSSSLRGYTTAWTASPE